MNSKEIEQLKDCEAHGKVTENYLSKRLFRTGGETSG
jgi:hypothetical protein